MAHVIKISFVVLMAVALIAAEANAQGRGRGRGQQQGMRGGPGNSGAQAARQQQMMRYRYRQGQGAFGSQGTAGQQLRDGSCLNQAGSGRQSGWGQGLSRGNRLQRGNLGMQGRGTKMRNPGDLTQAEIESLIEMREEEKLARDVYLTLAELWNAPTFSNIARSETRHMTVVGQLIQASGLEDPVTDETIGAFTNPKFSQMFNELVEAGSRSLADAYRVGVTIEEMDIQDLEDSLAQISNSNVRRVYENLLRASRNHLRAFSSQL